MSFFFLSFYSRLFLFTSLPILNRHRQVNIGHLIHFFGRWIARDAIDSILLSRFGLFRYPRQYLWTYKYNRQLAVGASVRSESIWVWSCRDRIATPLTQWPVRVCLSILFDMMRSSWIGSQDFDAINTQRPMFYISTCFPFVFVGSFFLTFFWFFKNDERINSSFIYFW